MSGAVGHHLKNKAIMSNLRMANELLYPKNWVKHVEAVKSMRRQDVLGNEVTLNGLYIPM
jgi:hypothetical protein